MKGKIEETAEVSLPSVYVVAHELKAPLLLVRQLALELQANSSDNPRTVERLLLTVERSLRLVEQLTKTSRLEDALFDMEPLQAYAVCQTVVDELEPFAKANHLRLETRISRRSGVVVGHRSLLTALLVNLCDNALNHSPRGSRVTLSANGRADGNIVFSVKDQAPRLNRQAFNLMRKQAGKTLLPISGERSSGLGLWIAAQFAKAMRGQMSIVQHHKAGITVSVTLPHSHQLTLL